jgi:hypothetical protein
MLCCSNLVCYAPATEAISVTVKAGGMCIFQYGIAFVLIVSALCTLGCVSTGTNGTTNLGFKTQPTAEAPKRVLSKRDFDHIINARLSRQETVKYLGNIAIEDYSIQDPNTNWSHASIGSADGKYSIYYLTYHRRYFILLLVDVDDKYTNCVDAILGSIPSAQYEIGMGSVEVNHGSIDGSVVVIFNKKWKDNYSDDIFAAFKPNLETKQIEVFKYTYLRILREE